MEKDLRFIAQSDSEIKEFINDDKYKKWINDNYEFLNKNYNQLDFEKISDEEDLTGLNEYKYSKEISSIEIEKCKKQIKPIKYKFSHIENGVVILKNEEKKIKHTTDSRKRLSECRRKRQKQPRSGTSKKCQSFKDQLKKDYKSLKSQEVNDFINNMQSYTTLEETIEAGFVIDFIINKFSHLEIGVDEMIYDPNQPLHNFEYSIDYELDRELFLQDLENTCNRIREQKKIDSIEFYLDLYKKIKQEYFDLYYFNSDLYEKNLEKIKDNLIDSFPKALSLIIKDMVENGVLEVY